MEQNQNTFVASFNLSPKREKDKPEHHPLPKFAWIGQEQNAISSRLNTQPQNIGNSLSPRIRLLTETKPFLEACKKVLYR